MPHYQQHRGRGGGMPTAPPRRLITIAVSIVSFFILAALAIAHFGPSSELHARKLAQRIEHAQRANAQFQSRDTPLGDKYLIGVGKADVTGPVVEIGFGGYADTSQIGSGLRQRLYSRAFIIGETKNPKNRVVYIVLDTLSGDTAVRNGVLDTLKGMGDEYAVYGQSNIALTGTHSHSGPGAWLNYLLPQITTLGFSKQSYQAIVDGTVLSIRRAHESLQEGYLDIGTTDINDGNANRSPSAYLANPESERAKYPFNTDKTLTLLRFRRASDLKSVGVLTWYPVHGTSVYQNNTLVNGDNKGVAAYLFEQSVKGDSRAADGFVAGFSQANVGDTTPNTLGAFCDDGSGAACDFESSTCADGKVQSCRGRGPFFQKLDKGVSSCYEIGRKQYAGAKNVWTSLDSTSTPVVGSTVRSFHYFHDMRYYKFNLDNGTEVQTCPAALGHSFAAGTTDGPGAFDFTQGDSGAPNNPFWSVVGGLLRVPSASQKACQKPKPILLDVGEMDLPYPWTPNIIDVQTLRVGQLFMIISPSEATTMSGRRWRDAVKAAAKSQKLTGSTVEPVVVLGGPANTYSHYVTTPEEYSIQRYEGASTLFGQYTLPAYINLTLSALPYLSPTSPSTSSPPPGPSPPDNRDKSLSFITGVVYDSAPPSKPFGTCLTQPSPSYPLGSVVTAVFQGANPRNNLRLERTFVAVEKLESDGKTWTTVRNDEDWDLTYEWKRTNGLLGYSEVTVRWETRGESNGEGADERGGVYRVRYWGDAKGVVGGKITAFEGTSREFRLT